MVQDDLKSLKILRAKPLKYLMRSMAGHQCHHSLDTLDDRRCELTLDDFDKLTRTSFLVNLNPVALINGRFVAMPGPARVMKEISHFCIGGITVTVKPS